MADQHNDNVPAVGNQIANDIPDIKENLEWHKDLLQMLIGWKSSTISTVSPPGPQRSQFTYSDTDTLTIGPGVYFHDGTTRQTVFWDSNITFDLGSGGDNTASDDLTANAWHYIYIDDSAVVTQASPELDADCFLNDTTAPTWSDSKHGWYSGSDLCIFAVYTNASSEIREFLHTGDVVKFVDQITSQSASAAATTSYGSLQPTLNAPGFCREVEVVFSSSYVSGAAFFSWKTKGASGTTGVYCGYVTSIITAALMFATVITDSSQQIDIKESANTTNTIAIYTVGWRFPVAM